MKWAITSWFPVGYGGFSFWQFWHTFTSCSQHQLDPGKKHPQESGMACLALDVCLVWLSQFMSLPGALVPVQSIDGFFAHHWEPCPEVQFIIPSKLVSVVTSNSVYSECLIFPFQGFFVFLPWNSFWCSFKGSSVEMERTALAWAADLSSLLFWK